MSQRLQTERLKYSVNALCLFTNTTNTSLKADFKKALSAKKTEVLRNDAKNTNYTDLLNKLDDETDKTKERFSTRTKKQPLPLPLPQSFVERYESEIAPPKVLKEYELLGAKHKKTLLKESKVLQIQYSEELLETTKMEKTVIKISNLLLDFVNILQSQKGLVDEINDSGRNTIDFVQDADDELILTLRRSESHQQSMVTLYLGLSFILLLLDFMTP